jgi:hypothetical protein
MLRKAPAGLLGPRTYSIMIRSRSLPSSAQTSRRVAIRTVAVVTVVAAAPVSAQTDYYNTDAGRPITVEDAYPIERRAVELQLAPLRLERARGGVYTWALEPEVAVGFLPRTQFEVGLPLAYVDAGPLGRATGLAGVELSVLHNLNVETTIPALAVVGDVLLPVGGLGPAQALASVKGIATKTFRWARFHANAAYTLGDEPEPEEIGLAEASRWMAGVAVDRTFPLRSALLTAEVVARQPLLADEDVEWGTAAGTRYQFSPRWALDAGVGYRFTGQERPWSVTFGGAYAFGLPWRRR